LGSDERLRATIVRNLSFATLSKPIVPSSTRSFSVSAVIATCVALSTSACGAAGSGPPTTPSRSELAMDEVRIQASHGEDGYRFDAYDAAELFERATASLNRQQCNEAVMLYDRVVAEFESSGYASAALYNAGLCLQAKGDFTGAAQRYARLRDAYPESEDRKDASFQLAEASIQLERWNEVLALADELLTEQELSADERLEAMARRAQALLGLGRVDEAAAYARGALGFFRARAAGEIKDEFFAAANNYVLAESARVRQQAMSFPAGVEAQKQVLLRRAELVLEAQREYLNTIAFKNLDNYHWAAASGYRIGSMYEQLWQAVTRAPVPDHLPRAAREEYHAELGRLIVPLIRNAIRYWEATELSIERAGIKTPWADKLKADLERVRALLLEQPGQGTDAAVDTQQEPGSVGPEQTPESVPRRALPGPSVPAAEPAAP
jgi:TolA-binding protein